METIVFQKHISPTTLAEEATQIQKTETPIIAGNSTQLYRF